MIVMVFSWIAVIVVVVWAARIFDLGERDETIRPRDILEERFARGEIDEEELRRRMRTLRA